MEMLSNWRMKPTVADSGPAAMACLDEAVQAGRPFSLVLLDAHMPDMDGFDLAERIHYAAGTGRRHRDDADLRRPDGGHRPLPGAGHCRLSDEADHAIGPVRQRSSRPCACLGRRSHAAASPTGDTATSRAARLRVLLAEDNPVNQTLALRLLEKWGHRLVVAHNGREALALLEQQHFDVVLMDVQMPEMSGFEATACIRQKGETDRRPRADHRHDRPRHEGGPRTLPGTRHGRLPGQADPGGRSVPGPGKHRPAAGADSPATTSRTQAGTCNSAGSTVVVGMHRLGGGPAAHRRR